MDAKDLMNDAEKRRTLFAGEMQMMNWGQSMQTGSWVKLWIHDEDMDYFKVIQARTGKTAGQRLGVVIVEIGDDEAIVTPPAAPAPPPAEHRKYTPPKVGELALVAVLWCKSAVFHRWMRAQPLFMDCEENSTALYDLLRQSDGKGAPANDESIAKAFILSACGVEDAHGVQASRKHLDIEPFATAFHQRIRRPFRDYLQREGLEP